MWNAIWDLEVYMEIMAKALILSLAALPTMVFSLPSNSREDNLAFQRYIVARMKISVKHKLFKSNDQFN